MIRKGNEAGRSMVEMMGYMGVVIALVAAIGNLVSNAYDEYKYSKAYLQLTDLAQGIIRASAIDVNYSEIVDKINDGDSEAVKIVPTSFKRAGGLLYHAFGGEVTIGGGIDNNYEKFSITFSGLSRKQCIELALKDWQNNHNIDLDSIIINQNYWYWPVNMQDAGANELPVTRVKVAGTGTSEADKGQCDKENDTNQIIWVFN